MLTLKELVNRCLAKDRAAWNEFVLRFEAIVEKSVRARMLRHKYPHTIEDVKDITQGIFLDIWEENRLDSVRDEERITGWLVIVAQNAAIDFIRSSKNLLRQSSVLIDNEGGETNIADTLAAPGDLRDELAKGELADLADRLISTWEPRARLIIKLSLLHNLSHKEIAKVLRIPVNTVSTVIRRSLIKLRDAFSRRGVKDF